MKLNPTIENFLNLHTDFQCGSSLPNDYPTSGKLEEFQIGYKIHGLTGASLTGNNKGDFNASWYVVCSNDHDDPFFVDLMAEETGFPVYFAFHGTGAWKPIKIAESLEIFSRYLIEIKKIEDDKQKVLFYLTAHVDIKNEFWEEVYLELSERDEDMENEAIDLDSEDWQLGKLIITNIGVNKLKIVNLLKEEFNLTPQDALALSKQQEIAFKEGYLIHLRRDIEKLNLLGATTYFKSN